MGASLRWNGAWLGCASLRGPLEPVRYEPVAVYVPRCPPRSDLLLHGFALLHEKLAPLSGAQVRACDGRTGVSADVGMARGEVA